MGRRLEERATAKMTAESPSEMHTKNTIEQARVFAAEIEQYANKLEILLRDSLTRKEAEAIVDTGRGSIYLELLFDKIWDQAETGKNWPECDK